MIQIFEEEDIPMVVKKPEFDFKGPALKDPFDREFWNMTQVHIKGEMYGYSKTTRLLVRLIIFTDGEHVGERAIQLIAWKNKQGKFIPVNKCSKDILDWCTRSRVFIKDNFWL